MVQTNNSSSPPPPKDEDNNTSSSENKNVLKSRDTNNQALPTSHIVIMKGATPQQERSDTVTPAGQPMQRESSLGNDSYHSFLDDQFHDDDDDGYYDDSSMGYSDDSASLSDAYFKPQTGGEGWNAATASARSLGYNYPINPYAMNNQSQHQQHTAYGSTSSFGNHRRESTSEAAFLPILEDTEITTYQQAPQRTAFDSEASLMTAGEAQALLSKPQQHRRQSSSSTGSTHLKPTRNPRRKVLTPQQRQKRMERLYQIKLRRDKQEEAVAKVRGKVQTGRHWRDAIWAFLFVAQLLAVSWCALRFGFGVILFHDASRSSPSSLDVDSDNNTSTFATTSPSSASSSLSIKDDNGLVFKNPSEHKDSIGNNRRLVDSTSATNDDTIIVSKNITLSDILFDNTNTDDVFPKTSNNVGSGTLVDSSSTSTATENNSTSSSDESGSSSSSGSPADSSTAENGFTIDYKNVLAITFFSGFYACILSYISFGFMLILARSLILIMLIFSILVALAWGIIGLTADPYGIISVMGFAALLSTLGYTMYSWNRIPFAATNLYTALTAMRCTADITILGLVSLVVAFGWCLLWSMAFVGVVNNFNHHDCSTKDVCHAHINNNHIPLYLLFLLSFHWTNMVIKNVVRVTVASAISTWWFEPSEVGPFCTSAVIRPLMRSLTTSFGSICLGSLIISPTRWLLSFGRLFCSCFCSDRSTDSSSCFDNPRPIPICFGHPDGEENNGVVTDSKTVDSAADTVGLCRRLSTCLNPCQKSLAGCNRWSFTYIGIYQYPFCEAGRRALQLFEARGWSELVDDPLVHNVLLMASVVIGGSTGVFAVVVEETDGFDFTSFHQPIITAFLIGSVLGYVLSNIMLLGVVGSAVNSIMVCFAAGPFDFDKNHPHLYREMRDVWGQQMMLLVNSKPTYSKPEHMQQGEVDKTPVSSNVTTGSSLA